MRTMFATLCVLLLLGGCERRGDSETASELDRSDNDTMGTAAPAADTASAPAADAAATALKWEPAPPALPTGARVAVTGGRFFTQVDAALTGRHTCANTSAGVAYCWGWNFYGQLGDGTRTDRATPAAVVGPS